MYLVQVDCCIFIVLGVWYGQLKNSEQKGLSGTMKFVDFLTNLAQAGLAAEMPGMRMYDRAPYRTRK